jgi:hypothetical protein
MTNDAAVETQAWFDRRQALELALKFLLRCPVSWAGRKFGMLTLSLGKPFDNWFRELARAQVAPRMPFVTLNDPKVHDGVHAAEVRLRISLDRCQFLHALTPCPRDQPLAQNDTTSDVTTEYRPLAAQLLETLRHEIIKANRCDLAGGVRRFACQPCEKMVSEHTMLQQRVLISELVVLAGCQEGLAVARKLDGPKQVGTPECDRRRGSKTERSGVAAVEKEDDRGLWGRSGGHDARQKF